MGKHVGALYGEAGVSARSGEDFGPPEVEADVVEGGVGVVGVEFAYEAVDDFGLSCGVAGARQLAAQVGDAVFLDNLVVVAAGYFHVELGVELAQLGIGLGVGPVAPAEQEDQQKDNVMGFHSIRP